MKEFEQKVFNELTLSLTLFRIYTSYLMKTLQNCVCGFRRNSLNQTSRFHPCE